MKELLSKITARQEKGQTLIEYALLVVLIAIVVIVTITALGPQIALFYTNISVVLFG